MYILISYTKFNCIEPLDCCIAQLVRLTAKVQIELNESLVQFAQLLLWSCFSIMIAEGCSRAYKYWPLLWSGVQVPTKQTWSQSGTLWTSKTSRMLYIVSFSAWCYWLSCIVQWIMRNIIPSVQTLTITISRIYHYIPLYQYTVPRFEVKQQVIV